MRRVSFQEGLIYSFRPELVPVVTVRSGETVDFVCQDSCGGQIRSARDTLDRLDINRVNGATGPARVVGSRPGDTLRVRIRDIRVAGEGFQSILPKVGVLGDDVP